MSILKLAESATAEILAARRAQDRAGAAVLKMLNALGFEGAVEAGALPRAHEVHGPLKPNHRRNHVRRSRKDWKCDLCTDKIPQGTQYFAKLGGAAEEVVNRYHLTCVRPEFLCCDQAAKQTAKADADAAVSLEM